MLTQLQDAVVVCIGGSSGIGFATARAALRAGATVRVIARDGTRLAQADASLRTHATTADQLSVRSADVQDADALERAVHDLSRIDHVFVSAGSAVLASLSDAPSIAVAVAPLEQRVRGAASVVSRLAPRLSSGGSFVLTGGISTDRPVAGAWATSVGTAAIEQMIRVLALELAPRRCNAISPGWIDTPMWDHLLGAAKADVFAGVVARTPIGRFPSEDDVAAAVLFLMANAGVTGETLHVDGGQRLT